MHDSDSQPDNDDVMPTTKKLAIKAFRRRPLVRPNDGTPFADYRLKAWDTWLDSLADNGIIQPEQAKRWKRPDPWSDKRNPIAPTGPGIFPKKKPILEFKGGRFEPRSKEDIDKQIADDRAEWNRPEWDGKKVKSNRDTVSSYPYKAPNENA